MMFTEFRSDTQHTRTHPNYHRNASKSTVNVQIFLKSLYSGGCGLSERGWFPKLQAPVEVTKSLCIAE